MRIFTDVRPGEGRIALLMFFNVLLILCAYYFMKPVREGWISLEEIKGYSKMEVKALTNFGQSMVLVLVVWGYGKLVNLYTRSALITRSTLFCMSNLVLFWLIQPGFLMPHIPYSGILYYLWVGMFGGFMVAQIWAYIADLFVDEQGRRLMPMIAIGATSGAVIGSWIVSSLTKSGVLASQDLLLASLVPLLGTIFLSRMADDGRWRSLSKPRQDGVKSDKVNHKQAFELLKSHPLLLATTVVTLLFNWVNTNGENILFHVIVQHAQELMVQQEVVNKSIFLKEFTTTFYGDFFFWVNIFALFLQAIVASRLLKFGGFGAILMLLPVIALSTNIAIGLIPALAMIKFMKIVENATDYSINNTAKHVLWLPLDSETKYKVKPTIDSLFMRFGDGLAAVTAIVGTQYLALSVTGYCTLNVVLVLIWIGFGFVMIREHRKLTENVMVKVA
ncbi:MAG: hypothetical protein HQL53_04380 [Magnetococcales bacterium]|nr:hypothetical protein [Magnetococcales bacterium]